MSYRKVKPRLDHKERFMRLFEFKEVDRVPDYEFNFWPETIDRWHKEGLPLEKRTDRDVSLYFGFDMVSRKPYFFLQKLPVNTGLWPPLPERILEEKDGRAVLEDGMGGIYVRPVSTSSPPHYLRYPLKNREDWERLRPFFDPDTPGRFPLTWDEVVRGYDNRDYPLGIYVGSLYGWLRNWMGVQNISIAFYKDPDWIADMMDTLVNLWVKTIRKALRSVKIDFGIWWEDMCYSKGPLLSVRHFEEFMVPRYRKITDILREYGANINILDCDGDISLLVPGWLKAGINCMFPLEARFTDIYRLREIFGRRVLLIGGVNKMALMAGAKGIDDELRRLTPLLKDGGYIPMVDHFVPPEVSLADFEYYLKNKRRLIGKT